MRKSLSLAAVAFCVGVLSGCGGGGDPIETHDVKYQVRTFGPAFHLSNGTTVNGSVLATVKYRIRNKDGSMSDISEQTFNNTFEYSMKAEAGQSLMVSVSTESQQFFPPSVTITVDGEVWKQAFMPGNQTSVVMEGICCSK